MTEYWTPCRCISHAWDWFQFEIMLHFFISKALGLCFLFPVTHNLRRGEGGAAYIPQCLKLYFNISDLSPKLRTKSPHMHVICTTWQGFPDYRIHKSNTFKQAMNKFKLHIIVGNNNINRTKFNISKTQITRLLFRNYPLKAWAFSTSKSSMWTIKLSSFDWKVQVMGWCWFNLTGSSIIAWSQINYTLQNPNLKWCALLLLVLLD